MNIEQLITNLDQEMVKQYEDYVKCHRELDKHRGKPVDDTNLEEVNRILKDMQEKFLVLYPALQFIATRHEFVTNVTNEFQAFFETLKQASTEAENMKSNIITPTDSSGIIQ